jgi:hypothetical protein
VTTVHVLPTGETPEHHTLGNCPCRPRSIQIPRDDGTAELVTLHRAYDEATN